MRSGAIVVPAPDAFPREVRGYVQRLRRALDAAVQRGDLLRASDLRLSLEVQTILWLTPDVSRCEICGREFNNTRLARDNRQKVRA
ncbi:MAG: hypothetical protein WC277_12880 [Bacilli bacterium]|jgi:hypothetical protein